MIGPNTRPIIYTVKDTRARVRETPSSDIKSGTAGVMTEVPKVLGDVSKTAQVKQ